MTNTYSHFATNSSVFRQSIRDFIVISDSFEALEESIHLTYASFPGSKLILVLSQNNATTAEELINIGWREYKEIKTIVLIHLFKHVPYGEDLGTSNEQNFTYEAYFLNPFVIRHGKRGQIMNILMTDANSEYKTNIMLNFFRKSEENVQGFPIKICMKLSNNTSQLMEQYGRRTSYSNDNEVMNILVRAANFTPIYYEADSFLFGNTLENGTVTGSLREIESSDADILGDLRPIQNYGQKHSIFLFPPDQTSFRFLTPEMGTMSTVSFFNIFHFDIFTGLTVTYVGFVLIWRIFERLHKSREYTGWFDIVFILYRAVMVSPQKERKNTYERALVTAMLVFSMVISYFYQGKMVQVLMGSKVSLNIDTIQALADSDLAILTTVSYDDILREIAQNEVEKSAYAKIYQRQTVGINVTEKVMRVSQQKDAALLIRRVDCHWYRATVYDQKTGKNLLHVTKEGPPARYMAHMVHQTFPLKERFNKILHFISESGLIDKLKSNDNHKIGLKIMMRYRDLEEESDKNFYEMAELWFIFLSYLCGCKVAFVVFLFEIVLHKFWKKIG